MLFSYSKIENKNNILKNSIKHLNPIMQENIRNLILCLILNVIIFIN